MLQDVLGELYPKVRKSTLDCLEKCERTVSISKGELIVDIGDMPTRICTLEKGILRGFITDMDGRDTTDCFVYHTGDVVLSCSGLEEPSLVQIEALTDTIMKEYPRDIVMELMEQDLGLLMFYNRELKSALFRHWEEKVLLHHSSAMERYLWFLKEYPGLIDLIGNKYIASFLGMTPVTLSRLRRRLRDEQEAAAK